MPNTQTSVPAFSAGQVLTAAQMTEVNTGIPVFATTTTRDAAFGGTGEKVLAEGQFAYIEASNTTQYYDGAAWQTLVVGGLTLIKSQTIGSGVSTVTVSDVFSASYDNYKIIISGGAGSGSADCYLQLGSTTTGYYGSMIYCAFNSSTPQAASAGNNSANWNFAAALTTDSIHANIDLFSPFANDWTKINSWSYNFATTAGQMMGNLQNTTSYTSFTLGVTGQTVTGGTIRVYGYANS
jgi:hypothetical protein